MLAAALALVSRLLFTSGRAVQAEEAAEEGYAVALRIDDRKVHDELLSWWAAAKTTGPGHVDDGIAFCEELRGASSVFLRCFGGLFGSALRAMAGDIESGRIGSDEALHELAQYGLLHLRGGAAASRGQIELLARDYPAAERVLRDGWDLLGSLDESGFRATVGALLAHALVLQEHTDDAQAILDEVEALAHDDDIDAQIRVRVVRSLVRGRRGELERALALAHEAVELADRTDYVDLRTDTRIALADILVRARRRPEAVTAAEGALELFEAKGNVVAAATAKRLVEELRAAG